MRIYDLVNRPAWSTINTLLVFENILQNCTSICAVNLLAALGICREVFLSGHFHVSIIETEYHAAFNFIGLKVRVTGIADVLAYTRYGCVAHVNNIWRLEWRGKMCEFGVTKLHNGVMLNRPDGDAMHIDNMTWRFITKAIAGGEYDLAMIPYDKITRAMPTYDSSHALVQVKLVTDRWASGRALGRNYFNMARVCQYHHGAWVEKGVEYMCDLRMALYLLPCERRVVSPTFMRWLSIVMPKEFIGLPKYMRNLHYYAGRIVGYLPYEYLLRLENALQKAFAFIAQITPQVSLRRRRFETREIMRMKSSCYKSCNNDSFRAPCLKCNTLYSWAQDLAHFGMLYCDVNLFINHIRVLN